MDADQPETFNDRLSQWIASQGFWFQLRYSMSGGGGWSVALFHILRMAARVLVVLLLIAIGFAFYLNKRVDSGAFKEGLRDRFAAATSASDAEIAGFQRVQGKAKIRRIGAEGTSTSFFQTLEAGNLSFDMGFFDGLSGDWNAGIIEGNWIDAHVKAGANSSEEAQSAAESLFKRRRNFDVLGMVFTKARITWGFDERVGGIEDSKMVANRVSEGWRFNFTGGTFTQNWIRDFEIDELVMLCTPSELIVEKGNLVVGDGRVVLKDVRIEGGELPEISGRVIMQNVPIDRLVSGKVGERVAGSISGELEFSGSTNSTEGIAMDGTITLGERDMIQIRNDFPLLEALDVVDVFNSYKRVAFTKGGFNIKTGGGEMLVSGVSLEAKELMTLQGRVKVRFPTREEAARAIGENANSMIGSMVRDQEEAKKQKDMSLRRAAEARRKELEKGDGEDSAEKTQFFAGLATKREEKSVKQAAAQRALGMLIFEGGFRMTIPGDAFERSRILRERHPIDQATGRIGIDVVLRGTLPELTLSQAEELLRDGGTSR
ncbi:hypothetical protein [Haloferula sp.]|uniref:hypothetical protein n=1 Tax=Haloferula sp. TaxID=2497595 RepID=UPI0032A0D95B